MTRRLLIDAAHPEETRLAFLSGNRIEHFEAESSRDARIAGNIYLVQITRVEASLQAAFVEYGGKRQGFLSFPEIHPDYYQIPVADKGSEDADPSGAPEDAPVAVADGDQPPFMSADIAPPPVEPSGEQDYKMQEVIKNRQVILAQIVKEPRGNKGAALTSYISLPGRYCILMPNAAHAGFLSRKISDTRERERLRRVLEGISVPEGMSIIIRTAGMGHTDEEIKQDFEYLLQLWETIRAKTLDAEAPALIHENGGIIRRTLRDFYNGTDDIIVEGKEAFEDARTFMNKMVPEAHTNIELHENVPVFAHYGVERQVEDLISPLVQLKSGGYLVINQTEALVAIDVNSGRSTGERHIKDTALVTNLEAADEIARQLHLREMAGLVVIDFIDMAHSQHNREVEKRLRQAMFSGQAHARVGRLSPFGLLEMSLQRLHPALWEGRTQICQHCRGQGRVLLPETAALGALRAAEAYAFRMREEEKPEQIPVLRARREVVAYLLEHKTERIEALTKDDDAIITLKADNNIRADGRGFQFDGLPEEQAPEIIPDDTEPVLSADFDGIGESDQRRFGRGGAPQTQERGERSRGGRSRGGRSRGKRGGTGRSNGAARSNGAGRGDGAGRNNNERNTGRQKFRHGKGGEGRGDKRASGGRRRQSEKAEKKTWWQRLFTSGE